ncbi:MAG: alpha/beta hydrolase [Phycisphaerales bacterium]|jgi:pimeloyl-ACP methyl ester carboxylesterase|nr:alpha/beta hydrolase [Phycisphaerales bacterium]
MIRTALVLASLAALPAAAQERTDFTIKGYAEREYPVLIETPAPSIANGWAIVLLGNAARDDADWFQHSSWMVNRKDARDAVTLADDLVSRGYTVVRISGIANDDPERAKSPTRSTPYPYEDYLDQVRAALTEFRTRDIVADDHIILVGRALGGAAAVHLLGSDPQVAGAALISPARTCRLILDQSELSFAKLTIATQMDADEDGKRTHREYDAWQILNEENPIKGITFDEIDIDNDDFVSPWEIAAKLLAKPRADFDFAGDDSKDTFDQTWGEDILLKTTKPVLAIWGGTDEAAINLPLLKDRFEGVDRANIELAVFPRHAATLGIAAGPNVIGPINSSAVQRIGTWLDENFADAPAAKPDAAKTDAAD